MSDPRKEGDSLASLSLDELEDLIPNQPRKHAAVKRSADLAARIVATHKSDPELTQKRLAERFGCNLTTVAKALKSSNEGRTYDVGPGFVAARACPKCHHTRCGPKCACDCRAK